jgi:SAM-dependent methyltransferase
MTLVFLESLAMAATYPKSNVDFVPETRFGFWFLGTETWTFNVLRVAINGLKRLIPQPRSSYPLVLDAGCGQGKSFRLLIEQFSPSHLIGVDMEDKCLGRSRVAASKEGVSIELLRSDLAQLGVASNSVDLVFCHQTLHHLTQQELALREFYRVLKPGGVLLLAESTRTYIHSWLIRLLFRHPMEVQRSAEEYIAMVREQGFEFGPENVSLPYLWWSRADLGARERLGFGVPKQRQETLVNLVATKPVGQPTSRP